MGNPVAQFQILSRNPETHSRFYEKLFGWAIRADNALGYRMATTGAKKGIDGGFWPAPPEGKSMVTLYLEVEDVVAHVARARELGATVVIPPQKLPDGDEMAVVLDPEGIPVGLMKRR
jgi:predicted enzyme related to lactoylglutathione lyase